MGLAWTFFQHVYEHLNLANDPCEGDPDYSRDACVVAKTREWLFDHGCQPMDMKETGMCKFV